MAALPATIDLTMSDGKKVRLYDARIVPNGIPGEYTVTYSRWEVIVEGIWGNPVTGIDTSDDSG